MGANAGAGADATQVLSNLRALYMSDAWKGWRTSALEPLGVRDFGKAFDRFGEHVRREMREANLLANSDADNLRWLARVVERKLRAGEWAELKVAPVDRSLWTARLERHADGKLYVHQFADTEIIEVPDDTPEPPNPGAQWWQNRWQ